VVDAACDSRSFHGFTRSISHIRERNRVKDGVAPGKSSGCGSFAMLMSRSSIAQFEVRAGKDGAVYADIIRSDNTLQYGGVLGVGMRTLPVNFAICILPVK
jgi:hypothetical protein